VAAVATPLPDPAAERAALLFERHHDAVLGYCAWRLRVRDDAEEAAQTTFARAFGALRRGHLPRNERAWLVTIARNVCATLVTSPHRLREVAGDVPEHAAHDVDHGLDPALEAALAALPAGQRRAFLLREWQDLSYREIAAELGVSVGTVETWIFRGRRSLASALEHTRRGFGLAGLLRAFAPSAAAKVAAATVLATAVVATEQAVVEHESTPAVRPAAPAAPVASDSAGTTFVDRPIAHLRAPARGAAAPTVARQRAPKISPALAGGARPERAATPPAGGVVSQPIEPPVRSDPEPAQSTAPVPLAPPAAPPVQTPELPVAAPALPPVEAPSLPVDLPPLPSTDELPVSTPTLP
jgi:RNA polymerase sigma-70 factor (ECF subfamily)